MNINGEHVHLSQSQKESLLRFPIESILKLTGHLKGVPKKNSRGLMCRSPFREDPNPSFAIYFDKNRWHDFGTGESGGVLSLLERLEGFDAAQAYDWLSQQDPNFIPTYEEELKRRTVAKGSVYVIDSAVRGVTDPELLRYAASRCVSAEVLRDAYQITLHYRRSRYASPITAISIPTLNGGWNFRNATTKKCTTGSITTFSSRGEFTQWPTCDTVFITEGLFTHLSALQMFEGAGRPDFVCLNGVGNLDMAMDYIAPHRRIMASFDNDDPGRKAYAKLCSRFPDRHIEDISQMIAPHNDLNDFLCATLSAERAESEKKIETLRRLRLLSY